MPERFRSRKPCILTSFPSLPPTCASQTHIRHRSAEALTALLSNKKAQSVAGVGQCYVTSLPRGANLADMGWIGHTQLPSECVLYIFSNTDSTAEMEDFTGYFAYLVWAEVWGGSVHHHYQLSCPVSLHSADEERAYWFHCHSDSVILGSVSLMCRMQDQSKQ